MRIFTFFILFFLPCIALQAEKPEDKEICRGGHGGGGGYGGGGESRAGEERRAYNQGSVPEMIDDGI